MKFFEDKRNLFILWVCAIMLGAFTAIVERAINTSQEKVEVKVEKKNSLSLNSNDTLNIDKLDLTTQISLKQNPYLIPRDIIPAFFTPEKNIYDPIYALLILCIGIMFLFRVRKINLQNPFTVQLISAVYWAGTLCLIFAVIEHLRYLLLNRYILDQTRDLYHLPRSYFFNSILFWLGIFLSWLYRIFKKAELLQKEQELTV